MKKILIFSFVLKFVLACSSSVVGDVAGRADECGIEQVKSKFTNLSFDGPVNIEVVKGLYDERVGRHSEFQNNEWKKFIELAEEKGCVYSFSSDEKSWDSLSGVKGYALVQNGKAVSMIITKKS